MRINKSLLIISLIILAIAFFIVRPFIIDIVGAIVLSYVFYPAYSWINKKIKNNNFSAFIVTIGIVIVLVLATLLFITAIANEARTVFSLFQGALKGVNCDGTNSLLCNAINYYNSLEIVSQIRPLEKIVSTSTSFFIERTSGFLLSLPSRIMDLFVMFFVMYYLFKDGKLVVERIKRLLPISKQRENEIIKRLNDTTRAVIFGNLIIAIVQGSLAAVGFTLVGTSAPLLWGILTVFASFIPFLGAALVWLPLSLIRILEGLVSNNNTLIWAGVGLFLYGALMISSVDNILRPKLIGDRAKVHPIIILIGVLGGIRVFGFIGFIVGPVILGSMITLIDFYEKGKF